MSAKTPPIAHDFAGVTMPTSSHPAIRRVKRRDLQPSIHGNKLWKSSCLLIDYLQQHPPEHCNRIIDVGCGWGISGIWCAQNLQADVTSVDADPNVYPYLDAVAQLNGVTTTPLVSKFEHLSVSQLSKFDMLIAADICFWDELAHRVNTLVDRAVEAGVKRILIADPERAPFLVVAAHCIETHFAELFNWQVESDGIKAQGALLLIENA